MSESAVKFIGLARDFIMALFGALILFGVHVNETEAVGLIGILAPAVALGAFIYSNVNSPKGKL